MSDGRNLARFISRSAPLLDELLDDHRGDVDAALDTLRRTLDLGRKSPREIEERRAHLMEGR